MFNYVDLCGFHVVKHINSHECVEIGWVYGSCLLNQHGTALSEMDTSNYFRGSVVEHIWQRT